MTAIARIRLLQTAPTVTMVAMALLTMYVMASVVVSVRINPPPPQFAELINMCLSIGVMSTSSFEDRPDASISYWTVLKDGWKKENPDRPIFEGDTFWEVFQKISGPSSSSPSRTFQAKPYSASLPDQFQELCFNLGE